MEEKLNLDDIFTDIADAIREKTKTSDGIKTYDMAKKIRDIKGGSVDIVKPIYIEQKNPIPNTGFVKSIYFDTNLTTDQVDLLIKNANLNFIDDGSGMYSYPILLTSSKLIVIIDYSAAAEAERGAYWIIADFASNKTIYLSPTIASEMGREAGWYSEAFSSFNNGEISIEAEAVTTTEGITIGTQNGLLTDLVYIPSTIDTGETEIAKTLTDQYKLVEKVLTLDTENNASYDYDFINNINEATKEINIIKNIKVDTSTIDGLITKTILTYSNDRISKVSDYAFYECTLLKNISLPRVITIGMYAFAGCNRLENIDMPLLKTIDSYSFTNCNSLKSASFPSTTVIGSYAFQMCIALKNINIPLVETIYSNVFRHCYNLIDVNFPLVTRVYEYTYLECNSLKSANLPLITRIDTYAFGNCYGLVKLFISQKDSVCRLANKLAFNNCYHILGTTDSTHNPSGLKDGYIYVPASLLAQYKVATNWVTYASQIIGHEDLEAGATLPNYTTTSFTKQTWYSDEKLTNVVTSVSASGTYYCKLEA